MAEHGAFRTTSRAGGIENGRKVVCGADSCWGYCSFIARTRAVTEYQQALRIARSQRCADYVAAMLLANVEHRLGIADKVVEFRCGVARIQRHIDQS